MLTLATAALAVFCVTHIPFTHFSKLLHVVEQADPRVFDCA